VEATTFSLWNPPRVLGRTVVTIAALAIAGPTTSVRAAPPERCKAQAPVCEAPTLEDALLITGRDLYARANKLFDDKDYLGAVNAWEQVLLLMPDKEPELRVQLAHAHRGAYVATHDAQHLHAARRLFRAQLESLEPGSVERTGLEAEVADIEAKLAALAQAEAQAQADRDEAIRQTQIRLDHEALAKAEENHRLEIQRHHREVQKIYHGVGGSLTGLGVGTLAAMTAFLVQGARLDRDGQTLAASTGVDDDDYQDLLVKGAAQNRAAIATGVVGGVLMTAGISLLVVAAVRHKRGIWQSRTKQMAVLPTPGGLQLRF
jgi:tetratricopeptide (TPR) repeat protein